MSRIGLTKLRHDRSDGGIQGVGLIFGGFNGFECNSLEMRRGKYWWRWSN